LPAPSFDEFLPAEGVPIRFDVGVANLTLSGPVMMAKTALQRLVPCAVQLAAVVLKKGTAFISILGQSEISFAAIEGWRKHEE
jgi:hypothetical protein